MQQKIREMLKEAMKAKNEIALSVYRGLITAFTNELVKNGKTPQDALNDEECMTVIRRSIKQREDAISQFNAGGRSDLAESEEKELVVLKEFLPAQLSAEEVKVEVEKILGGMGDLDPKMLGKYIGACVSKLKDVANGTDIKQAVEVLVNKQ